jgi:hypothetical protein
MIRNDTELQVTLERIGCFQQRAAHLRRTETNLINYRLSVAGFLVEIDRMNLEVREYLLCHPSAAEPMQVDRQRVIRGGPLSHHRERMVG